MKVILLQDVKPHGKKGDLVEVSDGYARNVLIRKKQAMEATKSNINDWKLKQANQKRVAEENLAATGRKLPSNDSSAINKNSSHVEGRNRP